MDKDSASPPEESPVFDKKTDFLLKRQKGKELLTREEEVALFQLYDIGLQEASDELAVRNLRLVFKIASKYRRNGVLFEDLVQAGVKGLLKSINSFDWQKGFRLSTYAYQSIEWAIQQYVEKNHANIRLPISLRSSIREYLAVCSNFYKENGRYPSFKEAAIKMDLPEDQMRKIIHALYVSKSISLEDSLEEAEGLKYKDVVGEFSPLFDEMEEKNDRKILLSRIKTRYFTSTANPRKRDNWQMFLWYYGFREDGAVADPFTLEAIGNELGITRERVRQRLKDFIGFLKKHSDLIEMIRERIRPAISNINLFNQ